VAVLGAAIPYYPAVSSEAEVSSPSEVASEEGHSVDRQGEALVFEDQARKAEARGEDHLVGEAMEEVSAEVHRVGDHGCCCE
jgi:hypothetical protein